MRGAGPRWGYGIAASAVAAAVCGTVLVYALGRPYEQGTLALVAMWITTVVCGGLGARVVARVPGNAVGWLLIGLAGVTGWSLLAEVLAYAGLVRGRGWRPVAVVADVMDMASWLGLFAGLGLLLALFPDGRPASPRWRPIPLAIAVAFTGAWCGAIVQPGPQSDQFATVRNPVGVAWFGGIGEVLVAIFMFAALSTLLLAAASAVMRYRGATGEARLQLKWLGLVGFLVPAALAGCFIGDAVTRSDAAGSVALPIAATLIPSAMGLAVLRYRLYDIDRIISRTASYAVLSVCVATTFSVTAALVGVLGGGRSGWSVAAATVAAVCVGSAARRRVQACLDRRFDRTSVRSRQVVDAFLADVQDGRVDPAAIEEVLRRALRDPGLAIAVWLRHEREFADLAGRPTDVPAHAEILGPLDAPVAALIQDIRPRRASDRELLRRARLGLELARAAAEAEVRLREVDASRARLVEAGYAERRRLERDLHDGAQQRLVALGINVRRLQRSLPRTASILSPALDQVVDDIADAVADLRRLAAGLRPARLDDGLAAALADLARTSPVPVALELVDARPAEVVETAAYFVACEGVTNAVKHAAANRIVVRTAVDRGSFVVGVVDDGIGGARIGPRSGLAGLADRVAAHGGQLRMDSPAGGGTRLEALLPCDL